MELLCDPSDVAVAYTVFFFCFFPCRASCGQIRFTLHIALATISVFTAGTNGRAEAVLLSIHGGIL